MEIERDFHRSTFCWKLRTLKWFNGKWFFKEIERKCFHDTQNFIAGYRKHLGSVYPEPEQILLNDTVNTKQFSRYIIYNSKRKRIQHDNSVLYFTC